MELDRVISKGAMNGKCVIGTLDMRRISQASKKVENYNRHNWENDYGDSSDMLSIYRRDGHGKSEAYDR